MKHGATLKFTCAGGMRILNEQVMFSESLADPEGLYRQVRINILSTTLACYLVRPHAVMCCIGAGCLCCLGCLCTSCR